MRAWKVQWKNTTLNFDIALKKRKKERTKLQQTWDILNRFLISGGFEPIREIVSRCQNPDRKRCEEKKSVVAFFVSNSTKQRERRQTRSWMSWSGRCWPRSTEARCWSCCCGCSVAQNRFEQNSTGTGLGGRTSAIPQPSSSLSPGNFVASLTSTFTTWRSSTWPSWARWRRTFSRRRSRRRVSPTPTGCSGSISGWRGRSKAT